MKNYTEFCNAQAEKLFEIIDQHQGLLKWKKTWHVEGNSSLPKGISGFYRGVNLLNLLMVQIDSGYTSPSWLTFNQIKQQGGHVLKGAKGNHVCFFKMREIEIEEEIESDQQKMIPIFKMYTVFNLDQTSMAEQGDNSVSIAPMKLQQLLTVLDVSVSEFGNRAYFQSKDDVIVMPRREFFNEPNDYDVTLLHELVHWSGHHSRLDRDTIRDYDKSDAIRAEEELVAEIGSVYLASYFGLSGDLLNHASYVSSWKKLLDGKAVGRAMSQASKAFQWIVEKIEVQEVEAAA